MVRSRLLAPLTFAMVAATSSFGQSPEPKPEIFVPGQTKLLEPSTAQQENYLAKCIANPDDRISCHLARNSATDGGVENHIQGNVGTSAYVSCAQTGNVCLELATLNVRPTDQRSRMPSIDISILFELGKALVQRSESGKLGQIATALKDKINAGNAFAVVGHTDSTGAAPYNCDLSLRRARAVADWLVERGVPRQSLKVIGVGEHILRNSKDGAAPENRRVGIARRTENNKSLLTSMINLCAR